VIDLGLDNGIVVVGEGNFGTVRLEQVLIDIEPRTKRLQRGFKPLDGVFLTAVIKALIIDSRNVENHAKFPALGEENSVAPKPIEIDMIVEGGRFLPRFDGFVDSQHHRTSTRGKDCYGGIADDPERNLFVR
jgi:hypothetical protein